MAKAKRRARAEGRARRDTSVAGFQRADGTYIAAPKVSRAEAAAALAALTARFGDHG